MTIVYVKDLNTYFLMDKKYIFSIDKNIFLNKQRILFLSGEMIEFHFQSKQLNQKKKRKKKGI